MKHSVIAIAIMLLALGVANGEQAQPRAAQSTASPQRASSRSSYDPIAGKDTGHPKGIVETTLAQVNPQNKDYGEVIAALSFSAWC
jgi:hypothetical protein